MKKRVNGLCGIFIALMLPFCIVSNAQQAQGIYLSAKNFTDDSLAYTEHTYKIHVHHVFHQSSVKITAKQFTLLLNKDSVFGYKDKEGISHRFFNESEYTIIYADSNIVLYKALASAKTKYEEATYDYFFSKNVQSLIKQLSVYNIENTYRDNQEFKKLLETHFKNDDDLLEYDTTYHAYKIVRLLQLSKNKK